MAGLGDQGPIRGPELAVLVEEAVSHEAVAKASQQQRVVQWERRSEVDSEVDRGSGSELGEAGPGCGEPGVGDHREGERVDWPFLDESDPASDLASLGSREGQLAESRSAS